MNALQSAPSVYGELPVIPTEEGETDYEEGAVRKMSTSRKISDTSAVIPPEPSEYNFGFPALTPVRKLSQQSNRSDKEHHRKSVRGNSRLQLVKKETDKSSSVRESSSQSFEETLIRNKKISSTANRTPLIRKTSLSSTTSDASKAQAMSSHSSNYRRQNGGSCCSQEHSLQGTISGRRISRYQRESITAARQNNGILAFVKQPSSRQCLHQFPLLEPTYQLEPVVKFACFHGRIKTTIHELIVSILRGKTYEPRSCAKDVKYLAERMKMAVKELGLDRYKVIAVVQLGEMKQQGLEVASRSLWDSQRDSFVSTQFQNASLFCIATVFGVYLE